MESEKKQFFLDVPVRETRSETKKFLVDMAASKGLVLQYQPILTAWKVLRLFGLNLLLSNTHFVIYMKDQSITEHGHTITDMRQICSMEINCADLIELSEQIDQVVMTSIKATR